MTPREIELASEVIKVVANASPSDREYILGFADGLKAARELRQAETSRKLNTA